MSLSYTVWRLRLWLMDRAAAFACWVEPEYRYNHHESEDGHTITIWREPA